MPKKLEENTNLGIEMAMGMREDLDPIKRMEGNSETDHEYQCHFA